MSVPSEVMFSRCACRQLALLDSTVAAVPMLCGCQVDLERLLEKADGSMGGFDVAMAKLQETLTFLRGDMTESEAASMGGSTWFQWSLGGCLSWSSVLVVVLCVVLCRLCGT